MKPEGQVEARSAKPSRDLDIIVAPKARDRLMELIEREQLPGDVRDTLPVTRSLKCDGPATRAESGHVLPRSFRAAFNGYPYADEDRLMFNPDGGLSGYAYEDFSAHHFLLAINGGHLGRPTVAAPFRALTGYWLAATFGLKWLLQFAQLYGVPFRWATYADCLVMRWWWGNDSVSFQHCLVVVIRKRFLGFFPFPSVSVRQHTHT